MRIRGRRLLSLLAAIFSMAAGGIAWTGYASRFAQPESGRLPVPAGAVASNSVTVMAWNLAKCGFHRGGASFRTVEDVRATLDEMANVIRREEVDIAFISEAVWEAPPCQVNQVTHLSMASQLPYYVFGENYSFGLPWFRIRSGNAVISRLPIEPVELQRLSGSGYVWDPTNARRALWIRLEVGTTRLIACSVRNDSTDEMNNQRHAKELLSYLGENPALLAGDFNAEPSSPSMLLFSSQDQLSVHPESRLTFPSHRLQKQIDFVVAPRSWRLVRCSTPNTTLSDHLPVVCRFEIPQLTARMANKPLNLTKSPLRWSLIERFLTGAFAG